jgi:hypothetical protein
LKAELVTTLDIFNRTGDVVDDLRELELLEGERKTPFTLRHHGSTFRNGIVTMFLFRRGCLRLR